MVWVMNLKQCGFRERKKERVYYGVKQTVLNDRVNEDGGIGMWELESNNLPPFEIGCNVEEKGIYPRFGVRTNCF